MYVLATGTFNDREKLGPSLESEVTKIHELRDRGLTLGAYRRADDSGAEFLLDVTSEQEARELINQLPFARAGVLSFTYAELLEL